MTHDQLRAVAQLARHEPMIAAHVLTLADGVLQLLEELDEQRDATMTVDQSAAQWHRFVTIGAHQLLEAIESGEVTPLPAELAAMRALLWLNGEYALATRFADLLLRLQR